MLAKVNPRATGPRSAAVGAQKQADPKLYGELIIVTVNTKIRDVSADLVATDTT
jgi:hypothetical protein